MLRKSEAADASKAPSCTPLEAVRIAALLVQPVMPTSAGKLLDLLGQPAAQQISARWESPDTGHRATRTRRGVPRYQAE